MEINNLVTRAWKYAENAGYHKHIDIHKYINLMHCELSELVEADRLGKWLGDITDIEIKGFTRERYQEYYEKFFKGHVEEELADLIIRACDFAGIYQIDLEKHIEAKMTYNETSQNRPRKKKY